MELIATQQCTCNSIEIYEILNISNSIVDFIFGIIQELKKV